DGRRARHLSFGNWRIVMTISIEPPRTAPVSPISETRSRGDGAKSDMKSPATDALLGNYKRAPGRFTRGEGVYLFDETGKQFLDFVSGIAVNALGYADPGLQAAMHDAATGLIHVSNLYVTEPGERLAASLVEHSF